MHDRRMTMYEAAVRYYMQHETMESIARHLAVSRSSVSRLLADAREAGIVRISITEPAGTGTAAGRRLAEALDIRVHVTQAGDTTATARLDRVCRMAASILGQSVTDGQCIGVAWGVTMANVVRYLEPRPLRGAAVVQLNGGTNAQTNDSPHVGAVLEGFGAAFSARVVRFPVPAFFDYPATREAMWRERSVKQVLDLQQRLDVAVFGVGSLHGEVPSLVYTAGYLDDDELARLEAEGAVGDVCTVLLREDGSWADISFNERASGLPPDTLRQIATRICVVGDPLRAPAAIGALRAGVATDLVCDDVTAEVIAARL